MDETKKTKEKAPQIYALMGKILKEIDPIKKERKNTTQGYNFRGVEDAMNMLSPILAKHGVFPRTKSIETIRNDEVQSKLGTVGYHLVNRYTFAFVAEDGSSVETMVDGESIDYGDKSSNKAYSTAFREALWKIFIVPFETDDIENHDHELKTSKPTVAPNNPAIATYKKAIEAAKTVTELGSIWKDMPPVAQKALESFKDEMKAILITENNAV